MQEAPSKKPIKVRVGSEYEASAETMLKKITQLETYIKKVDRKIEQYTQKIEMEQTKNTDQKKVDLGLEVLKLKKKKYDA
jgi:hypothetical protein